MPVLLQGFQSIEEEEAFSNSFYEAIITQIQNLDKNSIRKKKIQASIPYKHRSRNPQKSIKTLNSVVHWKDYKQ